MTADQAQRDSSAASVVMALLLLAWLIGTPVLTWTGMITAAPFFGENPSAAEVAEAEKWLAGAAACALMAPLVGLVLAVRTRNRVLAWVFGVALAISIGALVFLALK